MTKQSKEPLSSYQLESRDGYLYVHLAGTIVSEEMRLAYQRDIEAASSAELNYGVLFDNRDATQASEDLRAAVWTWISSTPAIRRAAVVAHTGRVQRRVEQAAELNRVRIRAFENMEEAEAWLRSAASADRGA